MRPVFSTLLLLFFMVWIATPARCVISVMDDLSLDLTKPADQKKVLQFGTDLFGPSLPLTATDQGLGWGGTTGGSIREISVETTPLPIGLTWRTVVGVSINATVTTLKPLPNWNGVTHLYLRYSPDYRHWSEWQDIHQTNATDKPGTQQTFQGEPAVPSIARLPYELLLLQHQKMTGSNDDEEGDVRWILARNPHFFENCLPFMGYIQFLFEADVEPGQRVRGIDIRYSWGVSGLVGERRERIESEQEHADRDGPWHFKG